MRWAGARTCQPPAPQRPPGRAWLARGSEPLPTPQQDSVRLGSGGGARVDAFIFCL